MGAWGFGPFDSDSGLDAIDALERLVTEDTVTDDPWEQLSLWRSELQRILSIRDPHSAGEVYALVGLVAAARPAAVNTPPSHRESATRLEVAATGTDLGLEHHQGIVDLMPPGVAAGAVDTARSALDWLIGLDEWHQTWREPHTLLHYLHALALRLPTPH